MADAQKQGYSRNNSLDKAWQAIVDHYDVEEGSYVEKLIDKLDISESHLKTVETSAQGLVKNVRAQDSSIHMVDALLQEYSLDTQEGVLLMCLAEALMRIPDKDTADALIKDRLSTADWERHMGNSGSALVNASTWGLLMTGKVVKLDSSIEDSPGSILGRLVKKSGEPVIRSAMNQAMKIMGKQFVLGRTIDEALENSRKPRKQGYTYSFDMLGEAAMTAHDAKIYLDSYLNAISAAGADNSKNARDARSINEKAGSAYAEALQVHGQTSISIKLSALHPRYEAAQEDRVLTELYQTVIKLLELARKNDIGINIDAEEMDRLEISLKLFEKLFRSGVNKDWGKLGLVVQAYSKRGLHVLRWLTALSREQGELIPVRLVKGAYWDSEIKLSQQKGLPEYPVFTRKENTDISYLVCVDYMLSEETRGALFPQFATHNAHTVAAVMAAADVAKSKTGKARAFEFQRLHGMGDALYKAVLEPKSAQKVPVRIYAPVGAHKDLLPYLVRRLLENGANSSFVHRLVDAKVPVDELTGHPVEQVRRFKTLRNDRIPLPGDMFSDRRNSKGLNLWCEKHLKMVHQELRPWDAHQWTASTLMNEMKSVDTMPKTAEVIHSPRDLQESVGKVAWSTREQLRNCLAQATEFFPKWRDTVVEKRAAAIEKYADLLEEHMMEMMALCCREAGKTMQDGIDEVREAVDFCRYYAQEARKLQGEVELMPGPTGESNEFYCVGRGVFVCISPWNFPLAIFTGQVVAALVTGNCVLAKPAEQTSLIAARAVQLMHQAGIPPFALQLLLGDGAKIGPDLLSDNRVAGVAFTGSTGAAHSINRTLAARNGAIGTLIAETGGQNAMIVDSTALPEQVVRDVLMSSFASAGQRCSALRVLFAQDDIADQLIELLGGALRELRVDDPRFLSTDVGPVIDGEALQNLQEHIKTVTANSSWQARGRVDSSLTTGPDGSGRLKGHFLAPTIVEIKSLDELTEEHFGPVLHLIRYSSKQLQQVIDSINDSGFGLTLGIHTRNESAALSIERRIQVGNTYINRNQIGAVVGVQPFGGCGLSGTGPKAGGPHYLPRFVTERVRTINTTAVGGNATLLSLESGPLG